RNKPAEVRTQLLPPQRNRPFAPENYCLFQTAIHDGAIHYAGKAVPLLPENAQLIADLAEFRTGKRYHRKAKSLARGELLRRKPQRPPRHPRSSPGKVQLYASVKTSNYF